MSCAHFSSEKLPKRPGTILLLPRIQSSEGPFILLIYAFLVWEGRERAREPIAVSQQPASQPASAVCVCVCVCVQRLYVQIKKKIYKV